MMYLIYGEDHFRVREEVKRIVEAAHEKKVATVSLDAKETTPQALSDHLTASSLFSRKLAIFVRNLLTQGSAGLKEGAAELLGDVPDGVTVVLWEEGIPDRRSRLYGVLSKKAKLVERSPLERSQLREWIRQRAQKKGARLSAEAVATFAELVGTDLARADQELEKLALSAGRKTVEKEDIYPLVEAGVLPSIFDLLDALGDDSGRASLLAERMLAGGQEPLYLLSMIAYQLRNLLLVRDLLTRRPHTTPFQVARELRLHPYTAEKTLRQAKKFTMEELVDLHHRLTELDFAIKTGGIDASDAVILLTTRVPAR